MVTGFLLAPPWQVDNYDLKDAYGKDVRVYVYFEKWEETESNPVALEEAFITEACKLHDVSRLGYRLPPFHSLRLLLSYQALISVSPQSLSSSAFPLRQLDSPSLNFDASFPETKRPRTRALYSAQRGGMVGLGSCEI